MTPILSITLALVAGTPARAEVSESIQFIGFSSNGARAAYLGRRVARRGEGLADHYSLIRVVRVPSGATIATYRADAIVRLNPQGVATPVSRRTLLRENRDYARARKRSAWSALAGDYGFEVRAIDFSNGSVRLAPDPDASLDGQNHESFVNVTGVPGRPVGYTVLARTVEGEKLPVGHFRAASAEGELVMGQVRAFADPAGQRLAVVNSFARPGEHGIDVRSEVRFKVLPAPIRHPAVGSTSGVVGMQEGYRRYVGSYGGGVPSELPEAPVLHPRGLTPHEATDLYRQYTQMLGLPK